MICGRCSAQFGRYNGAFYATELFNCSLAITSFARYAEQRLHNCCLVMDVCRRPLLRRRGEKRCTSPGAGAERVTRKQFFQALHGRSRAHCRHAMIEVEATCKHSHFSRCSAGAWLRNVRYIKLLIYLNWSDHGPECLMAL
jgi:hypothetical protein